MALAYTAPTWEDGGGTGISASQLQALSNCVEGLVQGSDKALHEIVISGSTMTKTFADGSQETVATDVKGISSITKTGTVGLVDTYTITYTDGTTSTFEVTNGVPGGTYDADAFHKNDTTVSNITNDDKVPYYKDSNQTTVLITWANLKNNIKGIIPKIAILTINNVSSLPINMTWPGSIVKITSDMVCVKAELTDPIAQIDDWTISTGNNTLSISGIIEGSTSVTLYLAESSSI